MFRVIYEWMKGAMKKMFKSSDIKKINSSINVNVAMIDKLEEWQSMMLGEAGWCRDDIVSLRVEQAICQEFANVVTSELDISLNDVKMQDDIKRGLNGLNEALQDGLGLGSFIMRSVGEDKVEYLTPHKFIPVRWDSNGNLLDVYLVETKDVSETIRYFRFERHSIVAGHLTISNEAFKGTKEQISNRIDLAMVDEWVNLPEVVSYPKMKKMDIGFYRNPISNKIDGTMMGVSIFDAAIDHIQKADIQFGRLDWEYESAERAIHVDDLALKNAKLPARKRRLYRGLGIVEGPKELFKEFSPALRDENFIRGLNEYYRRIEFSCSLTYGDLSKTELVEKTATEIKTSKQKKYNMVNAIERNLELCLRDFIDGYAFYNAKLTSGYEVNITFKDSVLTSEETERAQDLQDVSAGVMPKWEYRMKWYNEDEATAKSKISDSDSAVNGYGA